MNTKKVYIYIIISNKLNSYYKNEFEKIWNSWRYLIWDFMIYWESEGGKNIKIIKNFIKEFSKSSRLNF